MTSFENRQYAIQMDRNDIKIEERASDHDIRILSIYTATNKGRGYLR